jgi:hypothetical protein
MKPQATSLRVTANDNKVPQYVILNRKTGPKENFYKDVLLLAPKNAWMTSELMEDWLGCVWEHHPGATEYACNGCILWLSNRIRNRLSNKNTGLVIILSGMASQLQPRDVSVNKLF